jgi:hypothetical protein
MVILSIAEIASCATEPHELKRREEQNEMEMLSRKVFDKYREVQQEGKYNMFSEEARLEVGLDKKDYLNLIENFDKYMERYNCAWNIIKDVKLFETELPSFCEYCKKTDILWVDRAGGMWMLPDDLREQVYAVEEKMHGVVYAVIDSLANLAGETVHMRSFLFSSDIDEDEPIAAFECDGGVGTYAYVINPDWDISEAGTIAIYEDEHGIHRSY